jgi:hypothetical protein
VVGDRCGLRAGVTGAAQPQRLLLAATRGKNKHREQDDAACTRCCVVLSVAHRPACKASTPECARRCSPCAWKPCAAAAAALALAAALPLPLPLLTLPLLPPRLLPLPQPPPLTLSPLPPLPQPYVSGASKQLRHFSVPCHVTLCNYVG